MKYTLEQIQNAYGVLVVAGNYMWLNVNDGSSFNEYVMVWNKAGVKSGLTCYGMKYKNIFELTANQALNNSTSQIYIYDYENFIRHFGARILKF